MNADVEQAVAAAVSALDVDSWAPLTAAERDLCRRALAPVEQSEPTQGAA
jgi:acyl-CoA reductase-like NAD-dependent aldehyde dehydrogenase